MSIYRTFGPLVSQLLLIYFETFPGGSQVSDRFPLGYLISVAMDLITVTSSKKDIHEILLC